jgi:hypothetical protein
VLEQLRASDGLVHGLARILVNEVQLHHIFRDVNPNGRESHFRFSWLALEASISFARSTLPGNGEALGTIGYFGSSDRPSRFIVTDDSGRM